MAEAENSILRGNPRVREMDSKALDRKREVGPTLRQLLDVIPEVEINLTGRVLHEQIVMRYAYPTASNPNYRACLDFDTWRERVLDNLVDTEAVDA